MMSVMFNVRGKVSAESLTELDSDCCVFVLDVTVCRLMLNRPRTKANTVKKGNGRKNLGHAGKRDPMRPGTGS